MRTSCLFVQSKKHQAETPRPLSTALALNTLFVHIRFSQAGFRSSRSQMTHRPSSTEVDHGHRALLQGQYCHLRSV